MTYLLHFCNNARQKRKLYITYKLYKYNKNNKYKCNP